MRRQDKAKNMERVNRLFEARSIKESAFNWNGKYEGEDDIHETDIVEEEEVAEGTMSLGDDIEVVEEEVTNITTDVSDETTFFNDADAERRMDKMER